MFDQSHLVFLQDTERYRGFSVVFPFKEPVNTGVSVQPHSNKVHLTPRREEILNLLNQRGFMSAKKIFQNLKEQPAPRTLRNDLMQLKEAGLINFEGHTKKAVWFVIK